MRWYDWMAMVFGSWTALAAGLALLLGRINAAMKATSDCSRSEACA